MRNKKSTSREVTPSNGAAENVVEDAVVESVAALEPITVPVLALKAAISCTGVKRTDVNGDKSDVPENLQGVNIATREGEVRVSATDGHRLFAYSIAIGPATLPAWLEKGVTVPLVLLREQLTMIEKLGGDAAVISYQTAAPRVLLSDPRDNVTFRLFPVEGDFPAYDGMLASINLSSRETLDLESTGYQAAYLKGVADLAKLLESPTVQVLGAGDDKPTLIMFPGCPGAVLALMPVMGIRDQALAPQQARILNPAITGTIGALRANRTRTLARLEKMPNNRLLQKKIEDYDQRINTLINRTQPQTALPAPATSPQLLDEDEVETTDDDGDIMRAAQRAEMEPLSPSLPSGDELADSEFDDDENEDVAPDMEPFDPSIESALRATATENADGSVTISPEEGEEVVGVIEDDHGDVEVLIEDTGDVLLTAPALNMPRPPRRVARAQVEEHDDGSVTITPDAGEVLDVSEMGDGDLAVHVEEEE